MNFETARILSTALTMALATASGTDARRQPAQADIPVQPSFELTTEAGGPFPSDRFTIADPAQNTGRRVQLPPPRDCRANASDCNDVTFLNKLDGFHLTPRLSIPFTGGIDVSSATSGTVFMIPLHGDARRRVGINQVVWDPPSRTLHAISDEQLEEHTQYVLVVTTGLRRSDGKGIARSEAYVRFARGAMIFKTRR